MIGMLILLLIIICIIGMITVDNDKLQKWLLISVGIIFYTTLVIILIQLFN